MVLPILVVGFQFPMYIVLVYRLPDEGNFILLFYCYVNFLKWLIEASISVIDKFNLSNLIGKHYVTKTIDRFTVKYPKFYLQLSVVYVLSIQLKTTKNFKFCNIFSQVTKLMFSKILVLCSGPERCYGLTTIIFCPF